MDLLYKASQFAFLCNRLIKNSQSNDAFRFRTPVPAASLSGKAPQFRVYEAPETPSVPVSSLPDAPVKPMEKAHMEANKLASDLANLVPEQHPGLTVDVSAVKTEAANLSSALKSNNTSNILKSLQNILSLTRNGGGEFYSTALKLFNLFKVSIKPQNKQPAGWLTQYMNQEKAKDWADQQKDNMQASLDAGSAVQDALNRSY